jgi:hypothetical protein
VYAHKLCYFWGTNYDGPQWFHGVSNIRGPAPGSEGKEMAAKPLMISSGILTTFHQAKPYEPTTFRSDHTRV